MAVLRCIPQQNMLNIAAARTMQPAARSSQNSTDKCMKYDMNRYEVNKLDLILCELNHIRHQTMNGQLKQLFRQQAAITHLSEVTSCINRCIQVIKSTIKCKTESRTAIYFNSRQITLFLTQGFFKKHSELSSSDIQHDYKCSMCCCSEYNCITVEKLWSVD